ncbi:MAG: DNA starvation/stationary phase protection protein [Acidimicrobiales bacterium]|nr:DNA starvation/stationary phase protection protein [Acidimicrobiales bacterium]HRW38490.1 DNA starvation/stationary phase protection protein [Aquihabitans sp.]
MASFTLPGLDDQQADTIRTALQERLEALIDTALTLKHIHWNVTGPTFIGVHEMLDPQVAGVHAMSDTLAERIAALGGSPNGLPGNLVASRSWDDYNVDRAPVPQHLEALDVVYSAVIAGHRAAIETTGELDPITEDILIGQTGDLEQYQWFVRAHLESADGALPTRDADQQAADRAQEVAG